MKIFSSTLFSSKAAALLISTIALSLATPSLKAQLIYATNLVQSTNNGAHFSGSNEYYGSQFTTDGTAASFTFNQVKIMFGPDGSYTFTSSPTSFAVALFSDSSGKPGTLLNSMSGVAPSSNGNYTYTNVGGVSLAANTPYWVVIESFGGNYYQSMTSSSTVTGGWSISNGNVYSTDLGVNWGSIGAVSFKPQLEITATAVPEPSTYAVFAGLGVLGFAAWRRRKSVPAKLAA